MVFDPKNLEDVEGADDVAEHPHAISLNEAANIARRVQDLIRAGDENTALNLIRHLHPADMGNILAGLPRTSRDTLLRVMSPDTVVWMLRQMNPVEAGRVGTRLGSQVLSFVFRQIHPQQALTTLRRLPFLKSREVAESLEDTLVDTEVFDLAPNTARALMVDQLPTVGIDDPVEAVRNSVRELGELRNKLTYVYVPMVRGRDGGDLLGQISMVDLALADNATPIQDIASPIFATVAVDTPAEECARLRRHYDLSQCR